MLAIPIMSETLIDNFGMRTTHQFIFKGWLWHTKCIVQIVAKVDAILTFLSGHTKPAQIYDQASINIGSQCTIMESIAVNLTVPGTMVRNRNIDLRLRIAKRWRDWIFLYGSEFPVFFDALPLRTHSINNYLEQYNLTKRHRLICQITTKNIQSMSGFT